MLLIVLAYLGGVLTILSPCILPVLPFVFARADQPFVRTGLPLLAGMALTFAVVATLAAVGGGWVAQANQAGRWIAIVLLAFLMMITRSKAVPQVIGFLAMENGLFFAATSATYGMPMVVELGIALDVLIGMVILGVFFFQIRERFDSLDIRHLEKLKED